MKWKKHDEKADELGPSEIGDIGERFACDYLEGKGLTIAAIGSHALKRHAMDTLASGELWHHLTEEQIRFIFRPIYPRCSWWPNMHPMYRKYYGSYEKPGHDEFLERTKRGGDKSDQQPLFDWVSWDFVGWREHVGDAFLFEVKTGRPGIRPDGLRSKGRTGMDDLGLQEASRVGFQPLLVKVQLNEDGTADVWDEDIFVPEVSNKRGLRGWQIIE